MSSEKLRPLLIVEDDPALQKQIRWAFDQYERARWFRYVVICRRW